MKIEVETQVNASLSVVWQAWTDPAAIQQWNTASADWHTTHSEVNLHNGGRFVSRMEAKDGRASFDFAGVYTKVVPKYCIEYKLTDGRQVKVEFLQLPSGVLVKEIFETESQYPIEQQRAGWQSILNNFAKYVESHFDQLST